MKRKIKKSNIILLAAVVYVFIITAFEVLNIQNDIDKIGITKHKLNYIGCISAEDNVQISLTQGDSNYVEVTPGIEMFYSSGCLSLYGKGSALLTVKRNTVQEIYGKNNAIIKGEPGKALEYIQGSDNSIIELMIPDKNLNKMELNFSDNSFVKLFTKKIEKVDATADNNAIIKIIAEVDTAQERKLKHGRIFIKKVNFQTTEQK